MEATRSNVKEGDERFGTHIRSDVMGMIRSEAFKTRKPLRRILEERLRESYQRHPETIRPG